MASTGESETVLLQRPIFQRLVSSIHGNGVFSDSAEPVQIDHKAQGAVIIPIKKEGRSPGKIHFILPTLPGLPGGGPRTFTGVPPDEEPPEPEAEPPVPGKEARGVGRPIPTPSIVVDVDLVKLLGPIGGQKSIVTLVEIYTGETQYWVSQPLKETQSFSLRVDKPITPLIQGIKGLGVTITLDLVATNPLQFASVAVVATVQIIPPVVPP